MYRLEEAASQLNLSTGQLRKRLYKSGTSYKQLVLEIRNVRGKKRTEREQSGETWFFSERQYGAFSRSFRLPPDADAGKIDATLKDGVLTITVPKKTGSQAVPSKVEIRSG